MIRENIFESRTELEAALAAAILAKLELAIEQNGHAGILFSGGSTPKGLFQVLAKTDFDWSKVKIALVDDRVVSVDHDKSNIRFIMEYLLNNLGKLEGFYPWVIEPEDLEANMELAMDQIKAFGQADVAILGMGTDGHFASLFPGDEASASALNLEAKQALLYTRAPVAPKQRISCSWNYLKAIPNLYLHITGVEKKAVLAEEQNRKNLPINYVVEDQNTAVKLYWAP